MLLSFADFFNRALQNTFAAAQNYRSLYLSYIYYLRRQLDTLSKEDNCWDESVKEIRDFIVIAYDNLIKCSYCKYHARFCRPIDEFWHLIYWFLFQVLETKVIQNVNYLYGGLDLKQKLCTITSNFVIFGPIYLTRVMDKLRRTGSDTSQWNGG